MSGRAGLRRGARLTVIVVLSGTVLGFLASYALQSANLRVNPIYLSALCILGLALFRLGRHMMSDLEPPNRMRHGPQPVESRRLEVLLPLERRLSAATRQNRLFIASLQPMLWDLARERVRLHHGIDLDDARVRDPRTARELVGDDLWQWLTTTDDEAAPPSPATVEHLVLSVGRL